MNRCAKYLSKPAVSSSGQPVRVTKLIRKNFVEKHQLQSDLLSKISLVEGERVYFDSDRRHHKSDGIIFQPDSPYTFSIDSDLLKWKWSEVRSVDLQVVLTPIPGVQSGTKGNIHTFVTQLYLCKLLLKQMSSDDLKLRKMTEMRGDPPREWNVHHPRNRISNYCIQGLEDRNEVLL